MSNQVIKQTEEMIFHIDYLSMTLFITFDEFITYWNKYFKFAFGDLVDTERRTAYFKEMWAALAGVTVLSDPVSPSRHGEYITLTIKGEGCKCISLGLISKYFGALIDDLILFRSTRADFTWDNLKFSPKEMGLFMEENINDARAFRSLAKRESLVIRRDPAKQNEKGGIGTSSVEFGDRSSSRMIRCYDKHGFTRLEFQAREGRAHEVLIEVLSQEDQYRYDTSLAHLLDFVDLEWQNWRDFVGSTERANMTLSKAREVTARRIALWHHKYISPSLSVMQDIDPSYTTNLLAHGRKKKRDRYSALLERDDYTEFLRDQDNDSK